MRKLLKEANDNIMELIDEVIKTRCDDNRGKDLCAKELYPEIDITCECNGNCCRNCKVSAMLEFRGIMMEKYLVDIPKSDMVNKQEFIEKVRNWLEKHTYDDRYWTSEGDDLLHGNLIDELVKHLEE